MGEFVFSSLFSQLGQTQPVDAETNFWTNLKRHHGFAYLTDLVVICTSSLVQLSFQSLLTTHVAFFPRVSCCDDRFPNNSNSFAFTANRPVSGTPEGFSDLSIATITELTTEVCPPSKRSASAHRSSGSQRTRSLLAIRVFVRAQNRPPNPDNEQRRLR